MIGLTNENMDEFINNLKKNNMHMSTEMEVLNAFQNFHDYILSKNIDDLKGMIDDDIIFEHMNGKKQTKDAFLNDILSGYIEYQKFDITNILITVGDEKVNLKCLLKTTAKVFDHVGIWKDNVDQNFMKIDGIWKLVN